MNPRIVLGFVCLCVAQVAVAQNYYEQYQQPQNGGVAHRPAPARLSPSSGPVTERPEPVAILKQINRHNEDGSYTYGFEGADGSFKIETKAQTGEVKGKYGYVDETGKVRVVEYGADKFGFQPVGEGITVAPPTLVDETLQQEPEEEAPQRNYPQPRPQQVQRALRPAPVPQYQAQPQQPQIPQQTTYELRAQPQQPSSRQQVLNTQTLQRPTFPAGSPLDVTYSAQQRPPRPEVDYSAPRAAHYAPQPQPQLQPQPQRQLQHQPQPQPQRQHQLSQGYDVQEQRAPQQFSYAPAPAPQRPVPVPVAAPRPKGLPQGGVSILDQLAKDYALPANGAAPLTDVSFGYY